MPPIRLSGTYRFAVALVVASLLGGAALTPAHAVTPNGRLQIIQLDVGQGDGALIISPLGEVAMIDDGTTGTPAMGRTVVQQLQDLGVTNIKYHFQSHYHSDHFANVDDIANAGITTGHYWDRGGSYSSSYYTTYVATAGTKRRTLVKDQVILLDSLSAHPVQIKCVNLNGAGLSTTDENTLSVILKITYGEFNAVYGGDAGGYNSGSYKDVESVVAPQVGGTVEVVKVHHHGSATSTNPTWLSTLAPKAAIISCGTGNSYGHPTAAAVGRLHTAGVKSYWTETGSGVAPNPTWDRVSNGQIIISATWEGAGVDTIRGNGFSETFINSGTAPGDTQAPTVALTSPDGGESWKAGSSHAITWTASDNVAVTGVDLAYSTNGGATFPNTIATGLANSGSYGWTVPDVPGTTVRVRVIARDAAGNAGRDSSASNFTIDLWTIVASTGAGGTITPSGTIAVVQGASQGFSIAPTTGYHVADVLVDGGTVGAVPSYTFTSVTANHTIAASFALDTFAITASAGAGGSVTPSGTVQVPYGGSQHFSIVPATGHHVLGLTVDGVPVTPDTAYTFTNVTAAHSLAATFSADEYALQVSTVGGGEVTKSPDQATYGFGTAVLLDAEPLAGWAFAGWSGDTTGTVDSVTVTITGSTAVTATFVDVGPPEVAVTAPAGGEIWMQGSMQEITWTASDNVGVDSVDVDYSVNGPAGPWLPVVRGLENTGSHYWLLPVEMSDSVLVRVTAYDSTGNGGSAVSDGPFQIGEATAGTWGSGPAVLALARPVPNPSRGATLLRFSLPVAGRARLEVVDVSGRRLGALEGEFGAGPQSWRWDGRDADGGAPGAGLYFVRLVTPWGTRTERLVRLN